MMGSAAVPGAAARSCSWPARPSQGGSLRVCQQRARDHAVSSVPTRALYCAALLFPGPSSGAAQADTVRELKEGGGKGNSDPEVEAAVAELLRRKAAVERLETTVQQGQPEPHQQPQPSPDP